MLESRWIEPSGDVARKRSVCLISLMLTVVGVEEGSDATADRLTNPVDVVR